LVFLNGWPAGTDAHTPQPHPFCRIFLNGGAEQALKVSDFEDFHKAFGDGVTITRVERPRGSSVRKWLIAAFLIIVGVVVGYVAAHH
jgi:hypothetical protein